MRGVEASWGGLSSVAGVFPKRQSAKRGLPPIPAVGIGRLYPVCPSAFPVFSALLWLAMKRTGAILALAALAIAFSPLLSAQTGFDGPYPVVMDAAQTLPDYTIYRPADLSKVSGKLPVVAYGNGGCAFRGNIEESQLAQWASYGFIVTVPGPILRNGTEQVVPAGGIPAQAAPEGRGGAPQGAPPPAANNAQPNAPQAGAARGQGRGGQGGAAPRQSKPDQMITVMNWLQSENSRQGSIFRGKLDLDRIGVAGASCGGLEAISAATDPRVKTLVAMSSGIIRGGGPGVRGGGPGPGQSMPGSESDLQKLHTPVIYIIGGSKDIAYPNAEKDFESIQNVPLFNANIDVGHMGTSRELHGGAMGEVALAWLRWQLQGDKASAKMFEGANCGLCTDKRWTVKKKNME